MDEYIFDKVKNVDGIEGSVDILCHSIGHFNDFNIIFVVRYR